MSKEEDDDGATNIGVGRYPCMPSLVALQQMRNRLHLAYLGKKLMKWTALATGREIRKTAADLNETYGDFAEEIAQCYMLLSRCRYYFPKINAMVIEDIQHEAGVSVVTSIKAISAGVRCVQYEILESEHPPYPYLGLDMGGRIINETKTAWRNLLKRMILILQLRNSFQALDSANRAATKKQNVLAKMIVPKLLQTIKYILSELEELEREDNFRLKTFKKAKLKMMAAKGKGICTCCLSSFQLSDKTINENNKGELTCPKCAKGFEVSRKVCDNVGDKVMQYLEEHRDEIMKWANQGKVQNILAKPCCNLKDLPSAPAGSCIPATETIDISFMNKVTSVDIPKQEPKEKPKEVKLSEPCVACELSKEKQVVLKQVPKHSCFEPDLSKELKLSETEPCFACRLNKEKQVPKLASKELKLSETEPCFTCRLEKEKSAGNLANKASQHQTCVLKTCHPCNKDNADDKSCVACQVEKLHLEERLKLCMPCKEEKNYKRSRFHQHCAGLDHRFPAEKTPSKSSRTSRKTPTSSATEHNKMMPKKGNNNRGEQIEKIVTIKRTINADGSVDEEKNIVIKTKLLQTSSNTSSVCTTASISPYESTISTESKSPSRVKYTPSADVTTPCSCQFLKDTECAKECKKNISVGISTCERCSKHFVDPINTKPNLNRSITTSTTSVHSDKKAPLRHGDKKVWDVISDKCKESSQMYDPKIRSCISENLMYTLSELESRGVFVPSSTINQIPFKSSVFRKATNEIIHDRQNVDFKNFKKTPTTRDEEDKKSLLSEQSGNTKVIKSQHFICDPAFVSAGKAKDNKIINKIFPANTNYIKVFPIAPNDSLEKSNNNLVKKNDTEVNYVHDKKIDYCKKTNSVSIIEKHYEKQFGKCASKTKQSFSSHDIKPNQAMCKECLMELSGYIPSRTNFQRKFRDCKYCQMIIRKQLLQNRDIGTLPDSKSSIALSTASRNSLDHICIDLASSNNSIKVKKSLRNKINVGELKDGSIAKTQTIKEAYEVDQELAVDSLLDDFYNGISKEQKPNAIPQFNSLSSSSYELLERTSQQIRLQNKCSRCKRWHTMEKHSCTSPLQHFQEDSKSSVSKYKTTFEFRNLFVINKTNSTISPDLNADSIDLIDKSIQCDVQCSDSPCDEKVHFTLKDTFDNIERNVPTRSLPTLSQIKEGLCDGYKRPEEESHNCDSIELTLYRRVRENDSTVYKHITKPVSESCLKPTHALKPLCSISITSCCDKTCKQKCGITPEDPDGFNVENLFKDVSNKEVVTDNISGETRKPAPCAPPALCPQNYSVSKSAEASTSTKRNAKYDVRSLSMFPTLVQKVPSVTNLENTKNSRRSCSCHIMCTTTKQTVESVKNCKSQSTVPQSKFFRIEL